MKETIIIGHKKIGPNHEPFIIAEMSGNHNHDLNRALKIVDAAAEAGAHALKLQTYTADTMTLNCDKPDFVIEDPNSLWNGENLYGLYDKAHTPWEWHKPLFDRCKEHRMLCFSSPFDSTAVDFLETLNAPAYKIASFENTDIPLIKKVIKTGKPIIVSTGMATPDDLALITQTFKEANFNNFILLKCTSAYPASPEVANISTIPDIRKKYDCQVGLSDHTMGTAVPTLAVGFGATVIEKHFTLKRADGGVDSAFSLEPAELKALVENTKIAWQAVGTPTYGTPSDAEKKSLKFRRSVYFVNDLEENQVITDKDVRCIRPGFGLPPINLFKLIGRRTKQRIEKGTATSWDLVS